MVELFGLDLNTIWFVLVGVLLTGYAILDGFDLGVGILHLWAVKKDEERRVFLNAIGPVWDGNEVWLVTGGGALFAAFPNVYATVFSGFYLAFMALLCAMIFRAVSIEFRSKNASPAWRSFWDWSFSLGSTLAAFLIGVAMGNIVWGIPLDAHGEYAGTFLGLLNPYALLMGITTVSLFAMHGATYLILKTEGELQEKIKGMMNKLIIVFIMCWAILTMATLLYVPHLTEVFKNNPILFIGVIPLILFIANIPREINKGRPFHAFLSSAATMVGLMTVCGLGMYPNLVYSLPNPENSLTIFNAASSPKTLSIMLTMALIGIPLVVSYTFAIYSIFKGKVKIDKSSY